MPASRVIAEVSTVVLDKFDSGDRLHPNDAGCGAMAAVASAFLLK